MDEYLECIQEMPYELARGKCGDMIKELYKIITKHLLVHTEVMDDHTAGSYDDVEEDEKEEETANR